MAKRVRTTGRPAPKRAPTRRPGAASDAASKPTQAPQRIPEPVPAIDYGEAEEMPRASAGHLTEDEFARAEAIQDELAAQEKAAMAEQVRRRNRERTTTHIPEDINAPLKVRAAHEYAYVARDVRRIVLTGGLMVAILAVLAVLVNVVGVVNL
jgi:hypothetical protein